MARISTFCFPIQPLENARIKLVPFDVSTHLPPCFEATAPHPALYTYFPFGPFASAAALGAWYDARIAADDTNFLYAVLVKTPGGAEPQLGGIVGLLYADPANQSVEIGFVMTLPAHQRTHVTSNAVGLLLCYLLDAPRAGGLGLRRVQWQANAANEASIRAAQRMGFTLEGIVRWQRILPDGKLGSGDVSALAERNGLAQGPGRHSAVLAVCWDEWGVRRGGVVEMMDRR